MEVQQVNNKQYIEIEPLFEEIAASIEKLEDFVCTKKLIVGDKKLDIRIKTTCKKGKISFNCVGFSETNKKKERILSRHFCFIEWYRIVNFNASFIFMSIKRSLEHLNSEINKELKRN